MFRNRKSVQEAPEPGRSKLRVPILGAAIAVLISLAAFFFLRPQDSSPDYTDITPAAVSEDAFFMPGEFDPQEILLLGGDQLAGLHPGVMVDIIKAAAGDISIKVLSGSDEGRADIEKILEESHFSSGIVDILTLPCRTMWVRDFGPATVSDRHGSRSMVDFHYRERRGNNIDNGVPTHIAVGMGLNLMGSALLAEGGDYLSNGRGLCLLSTRVVNRNAHYLEMEPDQAMANFAAILGFEHLLLLPPLEGESTGHVDMFCALLKPDLVLVGRYEKEDDPDNAARLDGIVERLQDFPTLTGPLQVVRIPMPDHDDGVWRTYTNVVFANGVLLVPVYPDYCPDLDEQVLTLYRRLLPERRVVGIDTSGLIRMRGALRCITLNIPRGDVPVP